MFDFIKNLGTVELLIIAGILILLFGGKKIKELARGLGESKKEIKKVKEEISPSEKEKSSKSSKKEDEKKEEE